MTLLDAKTIVFCCILAVNCSTPGYGQRSDQNNFTLSVRSGLVNQTTTDHLLNRYNYSGGLMPFALDGLYSRYQHLFVFTALYQSGTLEPNNINRTYYEFNYVRHKEGELKLEYYHEITKSGKPFSAYVGISNSSSIVKQQEAYKNLLSSSADGYRKSFALSAISLSPALMMNVRMKKHDITVKGAYAILEYTVRPDDNFIKQLGLPETDHRVWYGPAKFKRAFFSCMYQYRFLEKTGITVEYNIRYRTYASQDHNRYFSHSFLLGLFKSF